MQSVLLNYLAKAEGTQIVRNVTEADITAPYGIYRIKNPVADIFKEIDKLAQRIGLQKGSKSWSQDDLDKLNSYIDDNRLANNLKLLVVSFYDDYLSDADMELYPKEAIITRFSLYVNSPKLANKATQEAINLFISNKFIDGNTLVVDGDTGVKTKEALGLIFNLSLQDSIDGYLFESYMLLSMSRQYAKLSVLNPKKFLVYLNGWNNRLEILAKF